MEFLGVPPGAAVAVFAQVVDHEAHVFQVPDARLRVPKPEALRMTTHQARRPLAQLRRSRTGRRQFAQGIRLGSHAAKLGCHRRMARCGLPAFDKGSARSLQPRT